MVVHRLLSAAIGLTELPESLRDAAGCMRVAATQMAVLSVYGFACLEYPAREDIGAKDVADRLNHRHPRTHTQYDARARVRSHTHTHTHRCKDVADHLNHRHRMAQFAGRASTDLHAHVFFKDRVAEEEAYVMRVRKNGVVVMLPRLGLEAPVIFAGDSGYELDRDAMGLTSPAAKAKRIRVLDRVRVRIEVKLIYCIIARCPGATEVSRIKAHAGQGRGARRVALRHMRARTHTQRETTQMHALQHEQNRHVHMKCTCRRDVGPTCVLPACSLRAL